MSLSVSGVLGDGPRQNFGRFVLLIVLIKLFGLINQGLRLAFRLLGIFRNCIRRGAVCVSVLVGASATCADSGYQEQSRNDYERFPRTGEDGRRRMHESRHVSTPKCDLSQI